jgi:hypothetical protein
MGKLPDISSSSPFSIVSMPKMCGINVPGELGWQSEVTTKTPSFLKIFWLHISFYPITTANLNWVSNFN